MPPKPASTPADLTALIDLTTSTSTLLAQFHASLAPAPQKPTTTTTTTTTPEAAKTADDDKSHDPLPDTSSIADPPALLADAARLLKAHTTKLSLLLLNDPFTATAVARVLREVGGAVVPAMVGGVEALAGARRRRADGGGSGAAGVPAPVPVPRAVERDVRARVRRIVGAVAEEVREVEARAKAEAEAEGKGRKEGGGGGRDALSSTGLVWEACDALIEVQEKGVVGIVVQKVEGWRGLLLDAVEELKEWGEDDDDDDEGDGKEDEGEDSGGDDDDDGDDADSMDDMFGGGGGAGDKLGKGNEKLRAQLDASLKKVKMITVLYMALVKRRLKTYPARGEAINVETMDALLEILQAIPDAVDDLASAYYDLDGEEANKVFAAICADAVRASDLVKRSWDGKDDEFTAWATKFQDAINA